MYIGSEDKKTKTALENVALTLYGEDQESAALEAVRPHSPKTSPGVQILGEMRTG